jgi:streptomycin 6-kinase
MKDKEVTKLQAKIMAQSKQYEGAPSPELQSLNVMTEHLKRQKEQAVGSDD